MPNFKGKKTIVGNREHKKKLGWGGGVNNLWPLFLFYPFLPEQLFLLHNILQPCHTGAYHYMPKGLRALEKLIRIVDEELQSIGAQKMSMPTMMQAHLWKSTGTHCTLYMVNVIKI